MEVERMSSGVAVVFRKYGVLFITALVFVFFAASEKFFYSPGNLLILLQQTSYYAIISVGLTAVVAAGEFDISFTSVLSFSAVLTIYLIKHGVNLYLSWGFAFLSAILIMLFTSFFVINLRVNSFIASLGTQALVAGVAKMLTRGGTIYMASYPKYFTLLGGSYVFKIIPVAALIGIGLSIIAVLILEYSRLGRTIHAAGINEEAAAHAGIDARKVKRRAYIFFGATLGLSGIMMVSMLGQGSPVIGNSYLFPCITATLLGAAFLRDGVPNAYGSLVASLLLAIFDNGSIHVKIPQGGLVKAVILLTSVAIVSVLNKRRMKGTPMV
jgi:ribose/xylose/arabinose/galactoside ABC-type transport system permease subunit